MLGFYFSPYGRICRKDFWLKYVLVFIGVSIAAVLADMLLFPGVIVATDTGPVEAATNLILIWPQLALTTKRFHDRGMSGWWQILFNAVIVVGAVIAISASLQNGAVYSEVQFDPESMVPLLIGVGIFFTVLIAELVILGFLPGTKGRNKYGDDPLNPVAANVAEVFS